ncbi:Ribosomal RNA small subunit methyltransferase A [Anaerohalosphaera lusitana]|uniref:Ribosomal RNA small subunit methyltransferase A n=1 Tax=Anaerohalosphaera lusitana TaxID=1936003 RepID=A0A1U9NH34_9BACT|nr:rRNA adenine dimethyltransferase family protein [Anaerohalosphaera lusitana]AQT67243.1 Ribosomal RNA small subunit methyltransferase A [Anaerohalosphaera lusitana]
MQTKHEIQRLLASAGARPNKKLGQNFLIDLNLMRLLIDAADIRKNDVVLEVGCGTGSFTEGLAEVAGRVVAAEYDKILARIAMQQLQDAEHVTIVNTDILESKNKLAPQIVEELARAKAELGGRLLLVANLPYNAGTSVMANLVGGTGEGLQNRPEGAENAVFEGENGVLGGGEKVGGGVGEPGIGLVADAMYVTVQKEVAQRMVAEPGGKLYGILSILIGACGESEILRILPPSVFWPAPGVESAMVSFERQAGKAARIRNMSVFKEIVNLFMGHRRKMMQACTKFAKGSELGGITDWGDIFDEAGVNPQMRPEKVLPDEFVEIANACAVRLGRK